MAMVADILLGAGALGAAAYCLVLAHRLRRFTELESGMGGAIAVLSAQVDEMTRALAQAQAAAGGAAATLEAERQRAEAAARHIEFLMAAMHDLPEPPAATAAATAAATGRQLRPAVGSDWR